MTQSIPIKSWIKLLTLFLALVSQDSANWPFGAWHRVSETPVISPQGAGWESAGTFNPAVILRDGKIYFEGPADAVLISSDAYIKQFLASAE